MEIKIKLDNNYIDPFGVPFHTILNSLNDPSKEIIQNKTQAIIKSKKTPAVIFPNQNLLIKIIELFLPY